MITKISIKNIKGYGAPATELPLKINPNKVNIIYAPNGSGKSSLAIAFDSLKQKSLSVEKENKFRKDEKIESELTITLDEVNYCANSDKNEIHDVLDCTVINCDLSVCTSRHNQGKFTSVTSYLDIKDIEMANVPENIGLSYSISRLRENFGTNGKVLTNYETLFNKRDLWEKCDNLYHELDKFRTQKKSRKLIESVQKKIQALEGTAESIKANIEDDWFYELEQETSYTDILKLFDNFIKGFDKKERFFFFFELIGFVTENRKNITKANKRTKYNSLRTFLDDNIALLDTTWKGIHTEEHKKVLYVKFPEANEISNGQRDLLTFFVELMKFRSKIKEGKKYLLIIDEIFDYLDDANTITAQYFLSTFLEKHKGFVYLCIFTHLNPFSFKNYLFTDKIVNHIYLKETIPCATESMKAFIAFRNSLIDSQKQLYDSLSGDLFHYNKNQPNYRTDLQHAKMKNLRSSWGDIQNLKVVLIEEVNKYLSEQLQYDPYGVAMALRLRVEKLVYEQLGDAADKEEFIKTHTTKKKFFFAESKGVFIPEAYYIVNAIHNEADHLTYNEKIGIYEEKAMVYKLQNRTIRKIIGRIFDWKGEALTSQTID